MTLHDPLHNCTVLIVDDDPGFCLNLELRLKERNCQVICANDAGSAIRCVTEAATPADIAFVDMWLPESPNAKPDRIMRGEELAYQIRRISPRTKIIGMSTGMQRPPDTPVPNLFAHFFYKSDIAPASSDDILYETLEGILSAARAPRAFIVHGHDTRTLIELKEFLRGSLGFSNIIVLHELPNSGRTVIEKFEQETRRVDVVFVLLTGDDAVVLVDGREERRARQNVIFELGFFYAKLQRTPGRVIVLRKNPVAEPSDVSGIVWIDISKGIEAAADEIRKELGVIGY
jgi:CheY-like chemotaxis protein